MRVHRVTTTRFNDSEVDRHRDADNNNKPRQGKQKARLLLTPSSKSHSINITAPGYCMEPRVSKLETSGHSHPVES